ncbi:MAG: hypothetical protein MJ252_08340, partial [archaeon]|nr:hypothetical protein [archaeon]
CDECSPEYYLTSNNTCDDCTINCVKCSGAEVADCLQCINKYALDAENICQNIGIEFCLYATDDLKGCKQCIEGYSLDKDGKCIQNCNIEKCISCPSSPDVCEKCSAEYYLVNNTCDDCTINCAECSGPEVSDCKRCVNGYALDDDNICVNIGVDYCLYTTLDRKGCRQCIEGYTLNSEGKCIQQSCLVEHCSSCPDSPDKCLSCSDEYFLSNNICYDCSTNCRKCTDSSIEGCSLCNEKYALDYESYCVYVNIPHCLYSSLDKSKCRQCQEGYSLDKDGKCIQKQCNPWGCTSCPESEDKCTICNDEFFLMGDICEDCVANCRTCTTNTQEGCTSCRQKYALDYDNICFNLEKNFCLKTDISKTNCRQCLNGFTLNSKGECIEGTCSVYGCTSCPDSDEKCLKCNDEFFLSENGTCLNCASNCRQCKDDSVDTCTSCNNGYALAHNNYCVKVNTKYCLKSDMSMKYCMECIEGYTLDNNGNCVQKKCQSEGCAQCIDNESICTVCKEGFFLEGKECKPCAENCRKCSDSSLAQCSLCNYDYGFNSEHKCIKVGSGFCLNSDKEEKTCDECIPGFHLNITQENETIIKTCDTDYYEFQIEAEGMNGEKGPFVLQQDLYSELKFKVKLNSPSDLGTDLFKTKINLKILNFNLPSLELFNPNIVIEYPYTNYVDVEVGIPCGTAVSPEMYDNTYTIGFEGSCTDIICNIKGSFDVKISKEIPKFKFTVLNTEIPFNSYSYLRLENNDHLHLMDYFMEFSCTPTENSKDPNGYCESMMFYKTKLKDRYYEIIQKYDTYNGLYAKVGSTSYTEGKNYNEFILTSSTECIAVEGKISFTVLNKEAESLNEEDKIKMINSIQRIDSVNPMTISLEINIPKPNTLIHCQTLLEPPFLEDSVIMEHPIPKGEYSFITNYSPNAGKFKIELLSLYRKNAKISHKAKCIFKTTNNKNEFISIIVGDYIYSDFNKELHLEYPSYYEPSLSVLKMKENINLSKLPELNRRLNGYFAKKINNGKINSVPMDLGCLYPEMTYHPDLNEVHIHIQSKGLCLSNIPKNIDQRIRNYEGDIKNEETIEQNLGLKGIPVDHCNGYRYTFPSEDPLTVKKVSYSNENVTLNIYNKDYNSLTVKYINQNYEKEIFSGNYDPTKFENSFIIKGESSMDIQLTGTDYKEKPFIYFIKAISNSDYLSIPYLSMPLGIPSPFGAILNPNIIKTGPMFIPIITFNSNTFKRTIPTECYDNRRTLKCLNKLEYPFLRKLSTFRKDIINSDIVLEGVSYLEEEQKKKLIDYYYTQLPKTNGIKEFFEGGYNFIMSLSSYDCYSSSNFDSCISFKSDKLSSFVSLFNPYYTCNYTLKELSSYASDENTYATLLIQYLTILERIARNPEAFTKDTSMEINTCYECLNANIKEAIKDIIKDDRDIINIMNRIISYLTEATQFDIIKGYSQSSSYSEFGMYVTELNLKIKRNIEGAIKSSIDKGRRYIDLGNTYSYIFYKEDYEGNEEETKTLNFPSVSNIVSISPSKLFKQFTNGETLEVTMYNTYPLISGTTNTISTGFVSLNMYDKDKNKIEVKEIKEDTQPLLSFDSSMFYVPYKHCYYYDETNNKIVEDEAPLNSEIIKSGWDCKIKHFSDFSIGNDKEFEPKEDEGGISIYLIIGIIALAIIILMIVGYIIYVKKIRPKRNIESDVEQQGDKLLPIS